MLGFTVVLCWYRKCCQKDFTCALCSAVSFPVACYLCSCLSPRLANKNFQHTTFCSCLWRFFRWTKVLWEIDFWVTLLFAFVFGCRKHDACEEEQLSVLYIPICSLWWLWASNFVELWDIAVCIKMLVLFSLIPCLLFGTKGSWWQGASCDQLTSACVCLNVELEMWSNWKKMKTNILKPWESNQSKWAY